MKFHFPSKKSVFFKLIKNDEKISKFSGNSSNSSKNLQISKKIFKFSKKISKFSKKSQNFQKNLQISKKSSNFDQKIILTTICLKNSTKSHLKSQKTDFESTLGEFFKFPSPKQNLKFVPI